MPLAHLKHKDTAGEFHRYLWAGSLAFGADFAVLFTATSLLGINYLISNIFGFALGLFVSYALCTKWVFRYRRMLNTSHEFLIFSGVALISLVLSELCMWVMVDVASVHYLIAKVIATGIIFLFNFVLRKILLFSSLWSPRTKH
jgi:putative flippase GtrA